MKKILTGVGVLLIVTVVGWWFLLVHNSTPKKDTPSDEEFIQVITSRFPTLLHEDSPLVKIQEVTRYDSNWYVIKISSLNTTTHDVPVYLISHDTDGILQIILGPDTHFTEAEMLQYNLPDSVMRELL